ncbi:MAG: hypothetical protein QM783_07230 [Phycisphaerales bacterium]
MRPLTFRRPPHRTPVWALVLLPVIALLISNADVLLLAVARPATDGHSLPLVLGTTIPLSLAAGGATLWFLLRLRAEVDRRAEAEREVRRALADLDTALYSASVCSAGSLTTASATTLQRSWRWSACMKRPTRPARRWCRRCACACWRCESRTA